MKDLKIDPDNTYVIETSGALDARLTSDTGKVPTSDELHVGDVLEDIKLKALREGRSVRINGDLVTISLDAYKRLSADAERVRWRKVSEESPPNMEILATYAKSGARTIWAPGEAPLGPDDLWRPLD